MRWALKLKQGNWKAVDFSTLRRGDIFKLFDGVKAEPVLSASGNTNFTALCDAYMDGQVLTIKCDEGPLTYLSEAEQMLVDEAIAKQKEVIARMEAAETKVEDAPQNMVV